MSAWINGRMFIRTPSFKSGCQPMASARRGFLATPSLPRVADRLRPYQTCFGRLSSCPGSLNDGPRSHNTNGGWTEKQRTHGYFEIGSSDLEPHRQPAAIKLEAPRLQRSLRLFSRTVASVYAKNAYIENPTSDALCRLLSRPVVSQYHYLRYVIFRKSYGAVSGCAE
jgi:hypothetical protein